MGIFIYVLLLLGIYSSGSSGIMKEIMNMTFGYYNRSHGLNQEYNGTHFLGFHPFPIGLVSHKIMTVNTVTRMKWLLSTIQAK